MMGVTVIIGSARATVTQVVLMPCYAYCRNLMLIVTVIYFIYLQRIAYKVDSLRL